MKARMMTLNVAWLLDGAQQCHSCQQETKATICTDTWNLDNRRLEKHYVVWRVAIWKELGVNSMKARIHPAIHKRFRIFSWHNSCPQVVTQHLLTARAFVSFVADHVHPCLTTSSTSSRKIIHVIWLKSSPTGFLHMTLSSLCLNGLCSKQISMQ